MRDPRIHERQPVPLRGLPEHRGCDQAGQVADEGGLTCGHLAISRADTVQSAVHARMASDTPPNAASVHAPSQYLAGGTTLIDLMKLDVMRPQNVTDINALERTPAARSSSGPTASASARWCGCRRPPIILMCAGTIR